MENRKNNPNKILSKILNKYYNFYIKYKDYNNNLFKIELN